jgi:hypothetical protein
VKFKVKSQDKIGPTKTSKPFESLAFGSEYKMGIGMIDLTVCHDGGKLILDCIIRVKKELSNGDIIFI